MRLTFGSNVSGVKTRPKHLLSRRDNPIVAWHEVPGKGPLESTVP